MLLRRIFQFLIIYILGISLLLGLKYALNLSNYVIPAPIELFTTVQDEFSRYFWESLDTLSVAVIG